MDSPTTPASSPKGKPAPSIRRHWKLATGIALGVALVILVCIAPQPASPYRVTRLGTLGGKTSWAKSINNAGQVVGSAQTKPGPYRPFIWTKEDGMQDIGTVAGKDIITVSNHPSGQVLVFDGNRYSLWTKEGGMQVLGFLDKSDGEASFINNAGQVVGRSKAPGGDWVAFLRSKEHGLQHLGTLGGKSSSAFGINDVGQIVGQSETMAGERHAFLWTKEHGMQDLGTLGGWGSSAHSVNNTGQMVGWALTKSGEIHAFLWTQESGMQDLDTLGGESSVAYSINSAGQVVGGSKTKNGDHHAMLWTKEHGMQELDTLGSSHSEAFSINDRGQIVGFIASMPPWWVNAWGWLGKNLHLPTNYRIDPDEYIYHEAVIWTIPPPEKETR